MPNYEVEENYFLAYVGLVPREIYYRPKEEVTKKPGAYPVDNTVYKYITFNEKVLMWCILGSIFLYCMKKKYFNNWCLGISK